MKQKYDLILPGFCTKTDLNPIIFLHGLFEWRRTWKKVGPMIVQKTGRKAYALDARNHGESPRSEVMTYEVLAQDVLDFMDEHNIERAVIVGHSMGGRTAINFALKYPERTEALVVEDMTPRNVGSGLETLVRMGIDFMLECMKSIPPKCDLDNAKRQLLRNLADFATEFQKLKDAERFFEVWDLDMLPITKVGDSIVPFCNLDAGISMVEANALVQDLPKKNLVYDGDALFLYGNLGFFNLGKDTSVRKLFPRATVKEIQGASHLIHIEFRERFTEMVSHFIQHRKLHEAKL